MRAGLLRVLNGRAAISPEMALRLEVCPGVENGGRADLWIRQQAAHERWQAGKRKVCRAVVLAA